MSADPRERCRALAARAAEVFAKIPTHQPEPGQVVRTAWREVVTSSRNLDHDPMIATLAADMMNRTLVGIDAPPPCSRSSDEIVESVGGARATLWRDQTRGEEMLSLDVAFRFVDQPDSARPS